jgi:DNA processing protein
MEEGEKKYWLAFSLFEGIGPVRFKLLLDYFGSAEKAFNAGERQLREIGLPQKTVDKFLIFRKKYNFGSDFVRFSDEGVKAVFSGEENYPDLLKEIDSAPSVLYVKLSERTSLKEIFRKKTIAVVGSRKMTPYGDRVTRALVKELVLKNWVIVSGLARGVDRVAHEVALENSGITVAVIGSGLDRVYPPEHKLLAERIVKNKGAILSEFPFGTKLSPANFPARNRIISGLCRGVLVTEAALDSGSLITASLAAEQGREVFAVPGPVNSPLSEGTASLIKKGAKLVTRVEDILEELD